MTDEDIRRWLTELRALDRAAVVIGTATHLHEDWSAVLVAIDDRRRLLRFGLGVEDPARVAQCGLALQRAAAALADVDAELPHSTVH